ncbi:MAG: fibronectin type III domain-containing protein [Acutalibacteraceae bacterium]
MKKLLSAIFAAVMLLSSLAISSFAVSYYGEEEAEFIDGYVYTGENVINHVVYYLKNGTTSANKTKHKYYSIVSFFDSEETAKNATEIEFVDEINGIPVETTDFRYAYIPQENSKIKKVVLPSKLCFVNKNAFRGFSALETVVFPKNSEKFVLGEKAFYGLKSLKKVVIRGGAVSIGEEAFKKCSALEKVTFDVDSVSFGEGAFSGCSALKSVSFPKKSSFGESSFAGTGFEALSLPATSSFNGESIFMNCKRLKKVEITADATVKSRVLLGEEMFRGCKKLETVSVSSKVNKLAIGEDAFKDCTALKKFIIASKSPEMLNGKAGSFVKHIPKTCKLYVENTEMKAAAKKAGFKGEIALTKVSVPTVKNLKVGGKTTSRIRLNWNKADSVTGYVVYCYSPEAKKYVKLSATDSLTFVATNLKAKTTYKFAVRAYKRVNGNNYYGSLSDPVVCKTR